MTDTEKHPIRWTESQPIDPAVLDLLEAELHLPRAVCHLIVKRGYTDPAKARAYMNPSLAAMHDPLLMKGVPELVERLVRAIRDKEPIGIHGDYDVDGLTSTTLLTTVLTELGAVVTPFVPHRMIDGYGVSLRAMRQFHDAGIRLVLTCDTGSSAGAEIRTAREKLGMEVLVTDHHYVSGVLPGADIFVNPHQPGDEYPFKDLCGVGVAFKVLQALVRRLGLREEDVLFPRLDLVALGTVADVVPLVDENRIFVRYGIEACKQTQNMGIRALLSQAKKLPDEIDEWTFGFALGPRLNAAGRIDDANVGLRLLLSKTPEEAKRLAVEIEELNNRRKAMTAAIEQSAIRQIEAWDNMDDRYAIALFGDDRTGPDATKWHHGVIGIVASRIVERYGRPTFLFARDATTDKFKGSGRAPKAGEVHLYHALDQCRPHLLKFGGHQAAAGATLTGQTPEELQQFSQAFDLAARGMMTPEDRIPQLKTDLEVSVDDLNAQLYGFIRHLAPFGQGNDPVRLVLRDVEVTEIRTDKKTASHLFLKICKDGVEAEAVAWRMGARYPDVANYPVPFSADLAFGLEIHEFKGQQQFRLILDDAKFPRLQTLNRKSDVAVMRDVPARTDDKNAPEPLVRRPDISALDVKPQASTGTPQRPVSRGFGAPKSTPSRNHGNRGASRTTSAAVDYFGLYRDASEQVLLDAPDGDLETVVARLDAKMSGYIKSLGERGREIESLLGGLPIAMVNPGLSDEIARASAARYEAVAYLAKQVSSVAPSLKNKPKSRRG